MSCWLTPPTARPLTRHQLRADTLGGNLTFFVFKRRASRCLGGAKPTRHTNGPPSRRSWGKIRTSNQVLGALRCCRAAIPLLKEQGYGRIINISGLNSRNAGNLSGGARNTSMVHLTKTLAVQLGQFGITVNCIHPGTTRTERTPSLLAARAEQLGVSLEEAEARDFAPGSPRGNHICRMVDASEIGYLTTFLASDKAWAITGELIAAAGGSGNAVYY